MQPRIGEAVTEATEGMVSEGEMQERKTRLVAQRDGSAVELVSRRQR